ncbi:conserved hypothetical protein [Leishmania mexicana MHOM/GT/2001/U1103]|uniref:Uncharacterized protein n=1 Tax=Leishmania mexicana (strain MHOM/GT/2001/U1103) TaxID=929439 RepID=E9AS04_LEIMU|nr:conserved hypothetical protein [Leishmania mexicana MHOM/GT/2001/U1103]CBZ25725.1 conserved hypothetical protein [Leishmania mexicana MHOM/GT/2001/U1103]
MSTVFTTNAWERSSPFQPNGAAHTDSDSTMDAGKLSSVGLRSGRGKDEVAAQNGQPFSHSADGLPGSRDLVAETDVMMDSGAATADYALVLTGSNTCGAVVVAHQPTTFPGMYENVKYQVRTLYAPPKPPNELLPRVKRQPRPGPVYDNDIATAGERQHRAQREVSRMWRGVLCRRRLGQARTLADVLNSRARCIQCWWRCLQARRRLRQLRAIRKEYAKELAARYVADRAENIKNIIFWQHRRYEDAAVLIQRALRWFLRGKQRTLYKMEGMPESELPPALERPATRKRRPYFAWRCPRITGNAGGGAPLADKLSDTDDGTLHTRTLLQFRKVRGPVQPPTQEKVEAINVKTRERIAQRQLALTTPEALSRAEWKTENIRHEDLDFNAGVLQRLYRSKQAPIKARTRQLTRDYFNKAARIVVRTLRMQIFIRRMRKHRARVQSQVKARMARHDAEKIQALKMEAVWQRELMDASAACIQRCYHWYRYERDGVVPASYAAGNFVPKAPPYGLIKEHIQRELAMRWASMNLMEQHEVVKQRHHVYLHYVPAKTIVCKHTGVFVAAPQAEL